MIRWGEKLEEKIAMLPDSPGCYLMKDASGEVIYVGKAVNLKNRVRSYFRDTAHTPKVAAMISHIDDFEILLCETNLEALILECNLIKLHQPYYNILLKDDKHYPYLKINPKEAFPRLELCRRMEKDGAKYYGPYIGASAVREVIETVRGVFPLRTCRQALPAKTLKRPCVNYDIGRCMAPCAGLCSEGAYAEMMKGVTRFLDGNYAEVIEALRAEMNQAAEAMRYERAAQIRDKIRDVEGLMERQIALRTDRSEQDLIAVSMDGLDAMIQVIYVRGGRMVGGDHFALPREGGEDPGEVIAGFMTQYYESAGLIPRNVLCQTLPEGAAQELEAWLREKKGSAVSVATPVRGEKHELVLLAEKNARDALEKRNARRTIQEERTIGAAEKLGKILGMDHYPRRIEGYDISNTQGEQSVSSMVVFIDGVPAKKEYRHFRIKTVVGANDFASHYETMRRRYLRAIAEGALESSIGPEKEGADGTKGGEKKFSDLQECPTGPEKEGADGTKDGEKKFSDLPDLILIDGGPQQLRFARQALLDLGITPPTMFGLAERLEEIWLPGAETPIVLDHHTPELQLVQRVRDEAHRFGIIHHRVLRARAFTHSRLEDIPGIGPARRKALLKAFGSIRAIREADTEALKKVPGMTEKAAEAVRASFGKEEKHGGGTLGQDHSASPD